MIINTKNDFEIFQMFHDDLVASYLLQSVKDAILEVSPHRGPMI